MLSLCRILYLCLAIYFFVKVMAKRVERYRLHAHNVGVMDDIKDTWNDNIKSSDLPPTKSTLKQSHQIRCEKFHSSKNYQA